MLILCPPASSKFKELFFRLFEASVLKIGVAGGGGGAAPILFWIYFGIVAF